VYGVRNVIVTSSTLITVSALVARDSQVMAIIAPNPWGMTSTQKKHRNSKNLGMSNDLANQGNLVTLGR
jgi:hypothetical protein